MTTVHPAFDIETGLWFVDEYQVDAPTLRQLKTKLPPRTKIKDYYPKGYLRPFTYSNEVTRKHYSSSAQSTTWARRTAPIKPLQNSSPIQKIKNPDSWQGWTNANVARLRELFLQDLSGSEIGSKLGCTRNTVVAKINRMKWRN